MQLLLKHGADITLRNYEGLTAVEVASPQLQQQLLDAVDKGGQHRNLLQAAWQGNAQLVNKILVSFSGLYNSMIVFHIDALNYCKPLTFGCPLGAQVLMLHNHINIVQMISSLKKTYKLSFVILCRQKTIDLILIVRIVMA